MGRIKRLVLKTASLIAALCIAAGGMECRVQAGLSEDPPQLPPTNIRIDPSDPTGFEGEGSIDPETNKPTCYVNLTWTSPPYNEAGNEGDPVVRRYLNFYLQEIGETVGPREQYFQQDIPDLPTTSYKLTRLKPGTVYYVDMTAQHDHRDSEGNIYTKGPSVPSTRYKFLTRMELEVEPYGPTQIKIRWSDVWDLSSEGNTYRLNYKLYIMQVSGTGTVPSDVYSSPPIYIRDEQIGPNGPVRPDKEEGMLEYIHTFPGDASQIAGRVFYVAVEPETVYGDFMYGRSDVRYGCTYINASVAKIAFTSMGTIWRLQWDSVGTGINYRIDKIIDGVPHPYVSAVGETKYDIVLPPEEEAGWYIIRANVESLYPDADIKIESRVIEIRDKAPVLIPQPAAPEFVNQLGDVSYADGVRHDRVDLLWRAPRREDGSIDTDVSYNLWILTSPDVEDQDLLEPLHITISSDNYVMDEDTGQILGYRYTVAGLNANTVYYMRLAARKEAEDGPVYSEPAIRIAVTLPRDGVEGRPVAPAQPAWIRSGPSDPFDESNTIKVDLKTEWYEQYVDSGGYLGCWRPAPEDYDPVQNPPDGVNYRLSRYRDQVEFEVYYVKYTAWVEKNYENASHEELRRLETTEANRVPPSSFHVLNGRVRVSIDGIESNTSYVIWARARYGQGEEFLSDPSAPIIVTTAPVIITEPETPVVPSFTYFYSEDTYVDLGWGFVVKEGYSYRIKYGTEEDIDKAQEIAKDITLADYTKGYFRVEGLEEDTLYYFWLKAKYTAPDGKVRESVWSDAISVRTKAPVPPGTPRGFGIKKDKGAIGKNSISYEWVKEEGMEYILEIAGDESYRDSVEYMVGAVSEYTVEGLLSNHRYFARLYAYDPVKKLRSNPTYSVIARTLRSQEDYDSDKDIDTVLTGDFVIKDPHAAGGLWNVRITGANAERFLQHVRTDRKLDYVLDISDMPDKTRQVAVTVEKKVLRGLSELGENLNILTKTAMLVIRPGVFDTGGALPGSLIVLNISFPDAGSLVSTEKLSFKTGVISLTASAVEGGKSTQIRRFESPLKVVFSHSGQGWFIEGVTSGYVKSPNGTWKAVETYQSPDRGGKGGQVYFALEEPGYFAVADRSRTRFRDTGTSRYGDAIEKLALIYDLKCVGGDLFKPDNRATILFCIELAMDVLGQDYSASAEKAVKAGLISIQDALYPEADCTREKGAAIAVRIYEIKTGQRASPSGEVNIYRDQAEISRELRDKVLFAAENGLLAVEPGKLLSPRAELSRGEFAFMLERALLLAGEIE